MPAEMEKYKPSTVTREIVYDVFRLCGWLIREFGLPRLSPYQRSPDAPNKDVSGLPRSPTQTETNTTP
jgi:hypothetical protein